MEDEKRLLCKFTTLLAFPFEWRTRALFAAT